MDKILESRNNFSSSCPSAYVKNIAKKSSKANVAFEDEISRSFLGEDIYDESDNLPKILFKNNHALPAMFKNNENISLDYLDSKSSGNYNPSIFYSEIPDKQPDSQHMCKARPLCAIVQKIFENFNIKVLNSLSRRLHIGLGQHELRAGMIRNVNSAFCSPNHAMIRERYLQLLVRNFPPDSNTKYFQFKNEDSPNAEDFFTGESR